ncbi:uncharacterized protein L203_105307 [Cryptococcus depauperatus CBS 7841]|uniref:Uncharacterized protein n=1 Tax=Cryptococcus depauperatus CBS 7841 TaxID=1295531 RepID=A0AAJ8JX72_9TREE
MGSSAGSSYTGFNPTTFPRESSTDSRGSGSQPDDRFHSGTQAVPDTTQDSPPPDIDHNELAKTYMLSTRMFFETVFKRHLEEDSKLLHDPKGFRKVIEKGMAELHKTLKTGNADKALEQNKILQMHFRSASKKSTCPSMSAWQEPINRWKEMADNLDTALGVKSIERRSKWNWIRKGLIKNGKYNKENRRAVEEKSVEWM